jgi:hypothetical protein
MSDRSVRLPDGAPVLIRPLTAAAGAGTVAVEPDLKA